MAAVIPIRQSPFWAKRENQPPSRQCNDASRTREYLTPDEVERMITADRRTDGRVAERNALLIMMAYRHGFRASELIALRWDQIDLKAGTLHVSRLKHGCGRHLIRYAGWSFEPCVPGSVTRATRHHICSRRCTAVR
jgi:integrase